VSEAAESYAGALPESVRQRVISLTADALGAMPADHVPSALRRVAGFAPSRRARLAGSQIAAVLETDAEFRGHVATQVRTVVPELARALDEGAVPAAADPVEVAGVSYLLRPLGWAELVERAGALQVQPAQQRSDETVERLQRQLSEARAEVRATRDRFRARLAEVKAENAELRRKLAETRQRLKAAEADAASAESARDEQVSAAATSESEIRRLRSRIAELEATAAASKRAARDDREQVSLRTRLLLDTLRESAEGLRRELALPPVSGSPADAVAAVEPGVSGTAGTTRARALDDPGLLGELLALPRVHLIVDGYNVTKTAWESAPLDKQRSLLMNGLAPLVARNQMETTVVFDGADLTNPPPVSGPRGVRVRFSPPGVIADVTIAQLVAAEPAGRPVVVVSSDREVANRAAQSGAHPVASIALVRLLVR
jgi:predicted RNA-binding protein with PIN domain